MKLLAYAGSITYTPALGYRVDCPDFNLEAFRKWSADRAIQSASEYVSTVVEGLIDSKADVPDIGRKNDRQVWVPLHMKTALRLLLYWEMNRLNMSKADLARRLDADEKQARRICAGKSVSLETQLATLTALNVRPALMVPEQ